MAVTRRHCEGFPCFGRSPLPGMPTPLPRRNRWMLSLSCPTATAFPLNQEGRLPPQVIFEACSAFTHVSACLFARSPKVTFTRVLQRMSLPPCAALVASGRATDWPGGIRTHWRSPTCTAYWVVDQSHALMSAETFSADRPRFAAVQLAGSLVITPP